MAKNTKARAITKAVVQSQTGLLGFLWGDKIDALVDSGFDKLEAAPSDSKAEDAAFRQRLRIQLMKEQAVAAQDFALAHRLLNADEVEIEEHYDGSGGGALGVDADAKSKTLMVGAKGKGRVVRKRIIRLKGFVGGEAPLEWIQKNINPGE